jgi:hypothetical protein
MRGEVVLVVDVSDGEAEMALLLLVSNKPNAPMKLREARDALAHSDSGIPNFEQGPSAHLCLP